MVAEFCQADDGPIVSGQGALRVTQRFAEHVRHSDLKVVRACAETPGSLQDINVRLNWFYFSQDSYMLT